MSLARFVSYATLGPDSSFTCHYCILLYYRHSVASCIAFYFASTGAKINVPYLSALTLSTNYPGPAQKLLPQFCANQATQCNEAALGLGWGANSTFYLFTSKNIDRMSGSAAGNNRTEALRRKRLAGKVACAECRRSVNEALSSIPRSTKLIAGSFYSLQVRCDREIPCAGAIAFSELEVAGP